jgi:hypothetical protein
MGLIHKDADLKRLVTKQDTFNIHKSLGFLSVCNFVYRYGYVYMTQGDLGYDGSIFDWITMIIHTVLACTAIFFHVPKKRIPDKPMVIYEEYRLHAMIFTLRCFFVFLIATLFPSRPWYVIPCVVGLHHYQADRITAKYGSPGNTAVRATSERLKISSFYKKLSLFYSFYQFLAIASHLVYSYRTADLGFNALIAIQSSAFLMTLYKKKVITGKTHMLGYSSCLVLSSYHIFRLLDTYTIILTILAFLTRINLRLSKYVIWSTFLIMKMNS